MGQDAEAVKQLNTKPLAWESVGGLEEVVNQLKEMVQFPLLYPEVFKQLGVSPPRSAYFQKYTS